MSFRRKKPESPYVGCYDSGVRCVKLLGNSYHEPPTTHPPPHLGTV
jgi:hypothetical protein